MKMLVCWHAAVEPGHRQFFCELSNLGIQVRLISPSQWVEGGRAQRFTPCECDNCETSILKTCFTNHIRAFFYPNILKIMGEFVNFKPDIIYIMEEPFSFAAYQFMFFKQLMAPKSKPLLFSFENIDFPQKFPFSTFQEFNLKSADGIIVVPKEGIELWRKRGFAGEIAHIPLGIDPDKFCPSPGEDTYSDIKEDSLFKIGYVGRIVKEKGLRTLLDSLSILKTRKKACALYLLGSGNYKENLLKTVKEEGLDQVFFIDAVSQDKLPAFYSLMDVLVLPSHTTPAWKEQFGRALIEAMACEVPVVGSSSGEIPQVIGDAGLVFPEGQAVALADALERLFLNPNLCEHLANKGRVRVRENFTWHIVAKKTAAVCRQLLSK